MFEIGRLTRLALGYESEGNSRPIEICVADWLADWPGATIGLLLMRPGEETYYPAAIKVLDGVLHFTPSRADMAIPGDGLAQIVMTDENDVELRSRVVRTMIECSLPGSEAEAPEEPMRPFVDQVLEAAASAVESAASAGKAAGNAAADAGRAEAAADNAEAAAKRAEEAAGMIGPGGGGTGTGTVTSVNGVQPDEAGNVEIDIPEPPKKLSELEGDAEHRLVTDTEKSTWNAKSTFSGKYADLTGKPTIPNVPSWALQSTKPTYTAAEVGALPSTYKPPTQTAQQVGADPAGTAASKVSTHNADEEAHPAIRQLVTTLSGRLSALADSDDTTLDQLSEIVAYIKSNKSLIDSITTGKVSVADIVDNLTSTATTKPLSAAQGKALKALIDAIVVPTKLSELAGDATHRLVTDAEKTAWNAKSTFSGKYADLTGKPTKISAFENDAGYAKQDNVDALTEEIAKLPNNKTLIDNVSSNVPIVKVAEQPTFVNDISECTDTSKVYVLQNGNLAAYMKTEITTEGETVPNFTNLYDKSKGAYIKEGYRFSSSHGGFTAEAGNCGIVIPLGLKYEGNVSHTIRVRGVTKNSASKADNYYFTDTNALSATPTNIKGGTWSGSTGYSVTVDGEEVVYVFKTNNTTYSYDYLVIHVDAGVDESKLAIALDEEISYTTTEGGTVTVTEWTDTGIEYNQPPDYAQRVTTLETKTAKLRTDVDALQNKVGSSSGTTTGGMDAFAFPAYPPSPQIPGDGSDEADFDTSNVATTEIYAYMDALWNRYRTYMIRQNLGKDASGQHDYYRYVFSKAYWRAWYKEGYPKMYAWQNGSTVVYSVSVSPRVGDTMYTTPYIGTVYSAVTAVNSETIGVASTRTVNSLVFTRYADGDVEPTIVYTVPFAITDSYMGRTYTDSFEPSSGVKQFTHEYIVNSAGVKFFRYPFEDKKLDGTRLFSVFILTNEHGNHGDSMIPSVVAMRMVKDMCENADVPFLRWLKENAVVTFIPVGNPYGGYNNANGVNVNRNYDTPGWAGSNTDPIGGTKEDGSFGAYAGDQTETQYIMNTIQQAKPKVGLSGHGRGVPVDAAGEYNSSAMFQGCGFDPERMWEVEATLFSMYNFGFQPNGQHTYTDQTSDSYLNAGKSPSYIEYAGAVGGLIEIDDYEVGTLDCFTPLAMEQAYAELMLTLQNWCEEALLKESETEE